MQTKTKQEEIREGITGIIIDCEEPDGVDASRAVRLIFQYLHDNGAVIKVEGELPPLLSRELYDIHEIGIAIRQAQLMTEAGFTTIKPLIGEK